jgi:hypothetical protein
MGPCCWHQHLQHGHVQVSARLEVKAASQLVLGNWPLLQVLMVAFIDIDEQVVHTLTTGNWPMLKELHVDLRPYPKWELPNVASWQAVEQLCESMCRQKWPDLEVLNIPSAQDMRMRMERNGLDLGYYIMM